MLARAHDQGCADALARFGIKTAEGSWMPRWPKGNGFVNGVAQNLIGRPGQLFVEGPRAFGAQGSLSAKNVFWPAVSGPTGSKWNWIPRANTLMLGNQLRHAITDPSDEPRAPRLLGTLGGAIGMAYGQHALGMLGAPIASGVGAALGRGLGNLIS